MRKEIKVGLLVLILAIMFFMFVGCGKTTTQEPTKEYWILEIMAIEVNEETGNNIYYIAEYGDSSGYRIEVYMNNGIESEETFNVGDLVIYIETDYGDYEEYMLVEIEN